ncbi:MAG: type II toxin-antitoxin system VapC family toxin [Bacteroidales bacterium]|nr:type II toxin-antitoxin system VapC family toxin [Bacteroidales bacterium]MCF8454722.1 type II toxin-antitoxin system VapC family toxin [Bacteroidales bacterium]
MRIFFDTSSLFKLYHKESGTEELMKFLSENPIESLYLAEITKIEFGSVVWKKCRKGEINEKQAVILIEKFEMDSIKFSFVPDTIQLKIQAIYLIAKHWKRGLRTLDSIQLASALAVKSEIGHLFTSDNILSEIAEAEGLKTH